MNINNPDPISEQINQAVFEAIESLRINDALVICPSSVAKIVLDGYLRGDTIDPHIARSAFLDYKQRARAILRGENRKQEDQAEQDDMFGIGLQDSYPCNRNGQEVYVLRKGMMPDEFRENAARLRKEGAAKIRHADALEVEAMRVEELLQAAG